jgi:predicted ATPase/class 3 adenylate cyclase
VTGRALPTGTLTFLFTDLEGSTRLLSELGDAYGELLEAHRRLIRDAVAAHGGVEFGTGGDALFVVFESCHEAVAAAAEAQRAMGSYPWPELAPLKVRMALHTGEAQVIDDDYVGVALHVVARLCAAGHGGQVLLSDTTHALTNDATTLALGVHRLRDVPVPMPIYQLCGEGLQQDHPPLRTVSGSANNLPAARDALIGRELDMVEVAEALQEHRLVTLVGPGGAGKTRLALEVAAALLGGMPDGVWFVQLGPATAPDQVEALTAEALHIGERGSEPLAQTLRDRLAEGELLLVLDNCEHLVGAVAGFVDELLARSSNLRVLATSRELLGIRGEQAIVVAPLAVGDSEHPGEAIALFVERAGAVVPGFDTATEDVALIAEVCRRLDGLPLAIELAAVRLRGMSLRQLANRLDDRFRLLASGPRTAEARQRTLEAVVAWSYELLDDRERAAFRRLAVFNDGFTLDAAAVVAGWGTVPSSSIADIVPKLVDKSLLVASRDGEEYRYHLLETLRHYGLQQLADDGEQDECRARVRLWARAWVDRLELDMRTPRQDASLADSRRERENLRAVYEQARTEGDLELALRIVTFAQIMLLRDRRTAIEELLDDARDVPPRLQGHALTAHSQFSFAVGLPKSGLETGEAAALIFEQMADRRLAAWARSLAMFCAWGLRPDDEVRARVQDLVEEFRVLEEPLGLAHMLWVSSQLELDDELAVSQATEAEVLLRAIGASFGLAHALEGRALVCLRVDDIITAAGCLSEALRLFATADERGCTAHGMEAIAALLAQEGQRAEAFELLAIAQHLRSDSGQAHRPWELRTLEMARELLSSDGTEVEELVGSALDFQAAVARAIHFVDVVREPS